MNLLRRGHARCPCPHRASALVLGLAIASSLGSAPSAAAAPVGPVAGLLPVAVDDTATVIHGRTRTVTSPGVLANDLQLGGGFTATLVSGPAHGSVDLDPDGGYSFDADLDFAGADQFRYRVDGGLLGLSNIATVRVTITNGAPTASNDAYSAVAGVERTVNAPGILADDDDPDGDALTVDIVSGPGDGALDWSTNGGFRYTADAAFVGQDVFRYRVWDGAAWSSDATVTLSVTAPPSTPTPSPPPTASPTPPPTATPKPPTATPTPIPTARTTPGASPTSTSLPTDAPGGSPIASPSSSPGAGQSSSIPTVAPSAAPSGAPGASPTPAPTSDPGVGATGGGSGEGKGPTSGGTSGGSTGVGTEPFFVPTGGETGSIELDTAFAAFGGFEWAVPALVLTVPGLLLMLAVFGQLVSGVFWLRIARRWLGGDRRSQSTEVADRGS